MDADDQEELEQNLSDHVLSQVERSIDHDQEELDNQHKQERHWHFVLLEVGQDSAVTFLGLEDVNR